MAKDNISKLKDCYGCGVCVRACPMKIISLKENKSGFYAPVITDQDKCTNCGICLGSCAFNSKEIDNVKEPAFYGGWSLDPVIREKCSTGGIGFEIARLLLKKGYKVIGVKYDPSTNRARHYIATSEEELLLSQGSKYIPSYSSDAFLSVERNCKYLVTGTPCQIDSYRKMARRLKMEDNFIFMDFFCHGVPSLLLWDKYLQMVRGRNGSDKVRSVKWREKKDGWHDSWTMCVDFSNPDSSSYRSKMTEGDLFYHFFLGNLCLNTCCYTSCKYKMMNSNADIRIGDMWGKKYSDDENGVNSVLAFTEKGKQIVEQLQETCMLVPEPPEAVMEGQMKKNARLSPARAFVMKALKSPLPLPVIRRVLDLMVGILHKIGK